MIRVRVKWMRHKHDVDCVESKLRGQGVARRKIMRDGAVGQAKVHALNAKNGGGLRGFERARGHIAKGRGLAVAGVDNKNAMTLRNQQCHSCAKTKFGIIRMGGNHGDIHGKFLWGSGGKHSIWQPILQ